MRAIKNLRKSIISGLLMLVMAASMFLGMGKIEAQAATKAAKDLVAGDKLNPGDELTYGGKIMICASSPFSWQEMEYEWNSVIIKENYMLEEGKVTDLVVTEIFGDFDYDENGDMFAIWVVYIDGTLEKEDTVTGPKVMSDGNMFDAAYYAATYPDVAAVLGTDEAALYNHYVNYGINEGRLPYAK